MHLERWRGRREGSGNQAQDGSGVLDSKWTTAGQQAGGAARRKKESTPGGRKGRGVAGRDQAIRPTRRGRGNRAGPARRADLREL